MNGTELDWTPVREYCEQPHWNTRVQNWLSTSRPSFAAANQVATLRRVQLNASCDWVDLLGLELSSVHVL